MALNNTTDRYNYIYGSNARKVERFEEDYIGTTSPRKENPSRNNPPETKKKVRAQGKHQEAFDWKYTFMTVSALAFLCLGALFYVGETAKMNQLAKEIKVLKTQKAELQSEQVAIQSEIDKSINLDDIRDYAEKKLKLTVPDHSSIIYYNQDSSDYFRQYESVEK